MPGPFRSRVAAWFIATLGLGGVWAEGAMAQPHPQLLRATLGPTDLVAEVAPAPTSLKSFALALGNRASETLLPDYFGTFFNWHKTSSITNDTTYLSNSNSSVISNISLFSPITRNAIDPVRRADVPSAFIAAYDSLRKSLDVRAKSLIQKYAALFVHLSSAWLRPIIHTSTKTARMRKRPPPGSSMIQLLGPRRFGSICGNSLVASAMATIIGYLCAG